jgi:ketosteroid isomerase-like protein
VANTVQEYYEQWTDAFNRGDGTALGSLYHRDCVFMPEPGRTAVMEAIDALLALKGTIDLRRTGVVEGPATALVYSDWTLNATGPDADPTALFSGKAQMCWPSKPTGTG